MDIFRYRDHLITDYRSYVSSFVTVREPRIGDIVDRTFRDGVLWPDPLIQLNPAFEPGESIDEFVGAGILHSLCARAFRKGKSAEDREGKPLRLHRHQAEAIKTAASRRNYVLTTGTGSGKSLAYIVPIVDHVLRRGSGKGIQAIVVYPMNALANSQHGELEKFLKFGFDDGRGPVTFARYTGQERETEKDAILAHPPDILLTNYVMLELIMTRPQERAFIESAAGLRFLVLDELHTYRGRQGADVALLVRRVREALHSPDMQCVGTSATLASSGTYDEQRTDVAKVASTIFGSDVEAADVIGETLRRTTEPYEDKDPAFIEALRSRVGDASIGVPTAFAAFRRDPLAIWIESTFGVMSEAVTGRLIRVKKPRTVTGAKGAARQLAEHTGVDEKRCIDAIQETLLLGFRIEHPETGFPAFAFRLHQFISRGDRVYASLEGEKERHLTVHGQQFVPGDRDRILLPLVFCRECGQEYYCVRRRIDEEGSRATYEPREVSDRHAEENSKAGYLFMNSVDPWPSRGTDAFIERLPEDWLEDRGGRFDVRSNRRKDLPLEVRIDTDGTESAGGEVFQFLPAPFRFCLHCGVSYSARQISDFGKVGALGSEGRSTATTVLSLSAIQNLKQETTLESRARKLLSFTDNRQDASLQAGHFNDFIEIGLLRSGLYRAVVDAGSAGLTHDALTQRVFDSLALPVEHYAIDPTVRFAALAETQRALRNVIGYRIYRDLKRGWRITSPNLEQCGLLEIQYLSLEDLAASEPDWNQCHAVLRTATPAKRAQIAKVLLDYLRRELAIKVDYLDSRFQEQLQQQSNQRLRSPWGIDENETVRSMEHSAVLLARPSRPGDVGDNVFLGPRSGFGQYLRRPTTFSGVKLTTAETQEIVQQMLDRLKEAGLVEVVSESGADKGYQVPASALIWKAGNGSRAFHDPIRVPREPEGGPRTNPFFIDFYRRVALDTKGLEAREHTAQVPSELRVRREDEFREASLPILYCSPTMELGVDISELNVVNLRNIPPTPANYAQRSGRAGRSGQPALVFSYCSTGNSHDQYFFRRPEQMVAGAVTPPRLDLTNEDLLRAHVDAIWLAETRQSLGKSLRDILDLAGEEPTLAFEASVAAGLSNRKALEHARAAANRVLCPLHGELRESDWWDDGWLDRTLSTSQQRIDEACERWRSLYRGALKQARVQNKIIQDATSSAEARSQATKLRYEAEAQLRLLTEVEKIAQSDFFSYRYFASEGFLPGYNFPRLPLSAFIPGRRTKQDDEFVSRPRFLAISEFGPRSFVYHEGSRYIINRVMLPVGADESMTVTAKLCPHCSYFHRGETHDLCESCGGGLRHSMTRLLRLQNVSTRRKDKISSDEEERVRLGYEVVTAIRFEEHGGRRRIQTGTASSEGEEVLALDYGQAATLWRINLGWKRRENKQQYGFVLDLERGYWQKSDLLEADDDDDPMSPKRDRVVPFVEDRRNSLVVRFKRELSDPEMASMQAALKTAIQVAFQLEDNELAAEPLPSNGRRRAILLYEASEGGAGVLRRLVHEPLALAQVADRALELCHFDPDTGDDVGKPPLLTEVCEAACYECLMTYSNQRDHALLDRRLIQPLLLQLRSSVVAVAPGAAAREEHLQQLDRIAGSSLEREWLQFLQEYKLRLPDSAQQLVESCGARPDFAYSASQTVVFVDGPVHEFPDRVARDRAKQDALEDAGYHVIRFTVRDEWLEIARKYPSTFGAPVMPAAQPKAAPFDRSLFPTRWQEPLAKLASDGLRVEPGADVLDDNAVIGSSVATVVAGTKRLTIIDRDAEHADAVASAVARTGETVLTLAPEAIDSVRTALQE
jgi:superfamily II DNA/RNA helicase/very-short-patch-repair endonuclease